MTRDQELLQLELLQDIRELLNSLLLASTPPGPATIVEFYEVIHGRRVKVEKMEVIKPGAKKLLKVIFKDAAGRVAQVDGVPKWSISDAAHGVLAPAADGMSCEVDFAADAPVGLGKVQVLADADMTPEGVEDLIGSYEYQLVSGKAVSVEISAEDVA
jgi:hypothetical protein